MNQPVTDPAYPEAPADGSAPSEEQTVSANGPATPNGQGSVMASTASLAALSWLNFLSALMQTGFGAFLAVYLTNQAWSRTDIGFALSAGTVVAMASQVPGGMLVDWAHSKRLAAAGAILALMAAAVLIAWRPWAGPVYAAQVLQGIAAAVLTPAVAALTLALSRQERLGERLGHNVRFAAIGSAVAAAIMGGVGAWLSYQAIYWLAALCALPCFVAIFRIRIADLETAPHRASHAAVIHHRTAQPKRMTQVCRDPALLVFAGCLALFQLGNAALLPTAAGAVTRAFHALPELRLTLSFLPQVQVRTSDLLVGAWIVAPQLLAAWLSPRLGSYAQVHNRRRLLLIGFAMLPIRALLFGAEGHPLVVAVFQMLDGVTAAVLGVMVPLVVADITHGGGRFNLAIGIVGLASGIGGALSTAAGGMLSDLIGDTGTFLALGGAGLACCLLLVFCMPETHQTPHLADVIPRQRRPRKDARRRDAQQGTAHRNGTPTRHENARRGDPRA
jgi:MFS family permease